jgi:hypothetical protein
MPQYANSRQKVMALLLNNVDGKPVEIDSSYGAIWTFDDAGKITAGLQEVMAELMNSIHDMTSTSATVVSIRPQLSKKRIAEKYRWTPSVADIERVSRDIWPKVKADRLKDARGVSQRRPPLTFDAKQAIRRASKSFWETASALQFLKEPSMKGFIFEARQQAQDDPEHRHLYEALAKMGEDQLELMRRQKSGKGVWYAIIEIFQSQEQGVMESVRVINEKCEGRAAAVVATRRLLAAHANLFGENITLEATVLTDIEWELR